MEDMRLGTGFCYLRFAGPIVDPVDGLAVIGDQALEVVATFAQAALEARTASHPTWSFARGETVTLRWSPPSDLVGDGVFVSVSLAVQPTSIPVMLIPPDGITFTVPSDHPVGVVQALVVINPASTWMDPALSCEQASNCLATQIRSYVHDANVY